MNLREIVTRPNHYSADVEEVQFVVEEYIYARKGRRINIDLTKGCMIFGEVNPIMYINQVEQLNKAFAVAKGWFLQNNFKYE